MLGVTAHNLVVIYGDQAYWQAIERAWLAFFMSDLKAHAVYSGAALDLFHAGYHEHPKRGS